ncbi:MAG: efflux RND transporter periplasmic adaptor subunit [Synechococcaceae cyanobacterium ELA182]
MLWLGALPLLGLLSACGAAPPKAQQPLTVQAVIVGPGRFAPGLDVVSRIQSTSNVVMRPEADGRVVRILAGQGQRVKAGQPILVLDNVQESATLDASRAEAVKDRANALRYIFLNDQGAVSTKDRDYYVTQAMQSRDQVRANAATLGYKFVTAPIEGILGNLDTVKLGDFVQKGQAITGIVNNAMLWTLMDVPATQASQVRLGLPVTVESQGNPPVRGVGRVVFISPYYSENSENSSPNTVLVKAVFPNLSGELKTGQFVKNRIITGVSEELAVPAQAVQMKASQPFVFKLYPLRQVLAKIKASAQVLPAQKQALEKLPGSTPIAVQVPVRLGPMQGGAFPVLQGLSKGDQVVVSNTALLRSGIPVKVAGSGSSN